MRTLPVRNPRTGQNDFEMTVHDGDAIAVVAERLRDAQAAWRDSGVDARIAVLQRFAKALEAHRSDIVAALSADTGRVALAHTEVDGVIAGVHRWCGLAPGLITEDRAALERMPGVDIARAVDPYPLLGAISPWNFPLLLSFIDATPALIAGCAVIIKPSEVTPRFAAPVEAAIADVPELARVLAFVTGDGSTGAALVPEVDVVAFTGSVATGRKVGVAAADAFVPAFLELGGKDAAIVLEGSDIERAATAVLRASVGATGQACQSIERVYVHTSLHDAFVARLAQLAEAVPLSYPDAGQGVLGPIIHDEQATLIASHLGDAVKQGATVHSGGSIETLGGGRWMRPTVLSGVTHDMAIMRDETFGPVMPVMAFETEAEAVALANDSLFGLSGAVFGPDEATAMRVADALQAGGISINDAGLTTMIAEAEKSAYRCSGIGPSRMGADGLTRFFRRRAYYINAGPVLSIAAYAEGQKQGD
ncbi:MAG: aldehyde dehydrogenase family protein [Pseudomonadota bacterium]